MADKRPEQLETECAGLLQELGLSEYEAYVFVYLLQLGNGTARDIAEMNHVPRTRVYDAVETLHEMGLVDIQYTSPRKFRPISRETAIRKLRVQHENTITELSESLAQLEPAEDHAEEFGAWTIIGRQSVASRLFEFIDDAEEEIIYMTVDELVTEEHLDYLEAAAERGVDIYIAGISDPVQERIRNRIPSVTLFETLWKWSEEGAGSLLITDHRSALVSVLVDGETLTDFQETAIWGVGEQNSLVVVLRAIFTWRLDVNEQGSTTE